MPWGGHKHPVLCFSQHVSSMTDHMAVCCRSALHQACSGSAYCHPYMFASQELPVQAGLAALSAGVRRALLQAAADQLHIPVTQVHLVSVRPARLQNQVCGRTSQLLTC